METCYICPIVSTGDIVGEVDEVVTHIYMYIYVFIYIYLAGSRFGGQLR